MDEVHCRCHHEGQVVRDSEYGRNLHPADGPGVSRLRGIRRPQEAWRPPVPPATNGPDRCENVSDGCGVRFTRSPSLSTSSFLTEIHSECEPAEMGTQLVRPAGVPVAILAWI